MIGGIDKRCWPLCGSLWWFLKNRWVSPLIWVICLAGTIVLFILIPKAFLPPGDSASSLVFIAPKARRRRRA